MTNEILRILSPSNLFNEWKDKEMVTWDTFIYNLTLHEISPYSQKFDSFNDIIDFYKNNFDVDISLTDIELRPYLFPFALNFANSRGVKLFPKGAECKKLFLYDRNFLLRYSNMMEMKIEKILMNFDYLMTVKRKLEINVFPIYQTKFGSFDLMKSEATLHERSSEVDENINPRSLQVITYDKTIKGVKYLEATFMNTNVNDELVYLTFRTGNTYFPESLKRLTHKDVSNRSLPKNLIDLKTWDIRKTTISKSLISLECYSDLYIKNENNLEALSIESANDVTFIPKNLKVLIVKRGTLDYDLSQFTSMEVLITNGVDEKKIVFPPNLKALRINYLEEISLPESLEYLSVQIIYDTYIPKTLKYLTIGFFAGDSLEDYEEDYGENYIKDMKSLVYLDLLQSVINIDMKWFPNLKYLTVNNRTYDKIRNMRDDIIVHVIEYENMEGQNYDIDSIF